MVPGCELLGRHWQQLQEGTQGHTDFAVNNANNWAKKLMWIDWIYFIWTEPTLLGSTQHPYRSFSWTVWAQTSRSHKSERTLAENLSPCWKLGEFCEVFNSDEDGWLWDKDQQYVKKTYAAQLLAKPSWNLGGLVFCTMSAVYVKDTLCRFAGQDARGILIRWLFPNFQRICVKVARASCKFPLVLWCRPFEALDPDKRITAEDDRHWELGTFSLPVFVADVKIWLWRELWDIISWRIPKP